MIARLRRGHRFAAYGFWVLLPLGFYLATASEPIPQMSELPVELLRASPSNAQIDWLRMDAATGIEVGLVRDGRSAGAVALRPAEPLRRPDVLAYWLESEPAPGEGVPEGAVLAGRLHGARAVSLVTPSTGSGGLLLFSLGHQERLGWLPLGAKP